MALISLDSILETDLRNLLTGLLARTNASVVQSGEGILEFDDQLASVGTCKEQIETVDGRFQPIEDVRSEFDLAHP